MSITPNNWHGFQHYKDRRPPWIKLHHSLLDDMDFMCLPVASRALAPCLWLIASEYDGGCITASISKLAFRLRMTEDELLEGLTPLISDGFFVSSEPLAKVEQSARLDRGETETEERKEKTTSAPSPSDSTPVAIELPCTGKGGKTFSVTEGRIEAWSKDFPGVDILQALRNMRAWLEANPSKAKTASGIPRFIVNWLSKEQNNQRPAPRPFQTPKRTSAVDEAFLAQLPASGGDVW